MPAGGSPAAMEERELWERLHAADPIAPSDLADRYLVPLLRWLERCQPNLDPGDYLTAAGEAIIALAKNPDTYDPERGKSLESYLRMSARGDLKNLVARERRRRKHLSRVTPEDVELVPAFGKYITNDADDPAWVVERDEEVRERLGQVAVPAPVRERATPEEERVLELMREKVRETSAYARVLGLTHLPLAEQRREVKRVKDRLKKRLVRAEGADG